MKLSSLLFSFIAAFVLLFSCNQSYTKDQVVGEWKYIEVESLKNPEESVSTADLKLVNPSINFYEDGTLVIIWDEKQLSKGKYKIEDNIIRYRESLPGGVTRPIPFLIKELKADQLVFETMDLEMTRITATKVK